MVGGLAVALAAGPAAEAPALAAAGTNQAAASVAAAHTSRAAPAAAVTVAVTAAGTGLPTYRIEVRNSGNSAVDTNVRQVLPRGAAPTGISGGGQLAASGGPDRGSEVTWRLQVPARGAAAVSTTLVPPATGAPVAAPACAFAAGGDTPYDCATATWDAASGGAAAGPAPPWWRRPAVLGGGLAALLVLLGAGWVSWRLWHRRTGLRRAASRQRAGVAAYDPHAMRGTLYPRPAAPRVVARRKPPVWLVVGVAAAILAGVGAAVAWTATARVSAIQTDRQPTSGAWVGKGAVGPVGAALRDSAFEFTVYRVSCPPAAKRCQATVGLRNVTQQEQQSYGSLQRAYLPDGNWVITDEAATRTANGDRDPFEAPVPAGGRLLLPLVFTMSGPEPPTQLELRGAVFSAGVRVSLG